MADSIYKVHEMINKIGWDIEDIDSKAVVSLAEKAGGLLSKGLVKEAGVAFDELGKMFNQKLTEMGKNTIDFTDMIKMPDDSTLEKMTSGFATAIANNIQDGIASGLKNGQKAAKSLLKNLSELNVAYERNKNASGEKTGKKIRSGFKNRAIEAFNYKTSGSAVNIGNNLRAIKNEFDRAENWEDQYTALLKYVKAYKELEKVSTNPKSLEKYQTIGNYTIDELKNSQVEIEQTLQNIFNVAYKKAAVGLTEAGEIDVSVKLVPIKTLDTYDITGGKDSVEVTVTPQVNKKEVKKELTQVLKEYKKEADDIVSTIGGGNSNDGTAQTAKARLKELKEKYIPLLKDTYKLQDEAFIDKQLEKIQRGDISSDNEIKTLAVELTKHKELSLRDILQKYYDVASKDEYSEDNDKKIQRLQSRLTSGLPKNLMGEVESVLETLIDNYQYNENALEEAAKWFEENNPSFKAAAEANKSKENAVQSNKDAANAAEKEKQAAEAATEAANKKAEANQKAAEAAEKERKAKEDAAKAEREALNNSKLTTSLREHFVSATKQQAQYAQSGGKMDVKESMRLVGANGIISTVQGDEFSVDAKTMVNQLIENLKNNILMSLHDHPDAMDAFTPEDINSFAKLYMGQGAQINGIIANGFIKTIDFTGISRDMALQIGKLFSDNISKAAQASGLFSYQDGQIIPSSVVKNIEESDPVQYSTAMNAIVELIDASLNDAFKEVTGKESTLKAFSKNELPELTRYLLDTQNSAENAIKPVEKLKNLMAAMYPSKTFDWSQYTSILDQFKNGKISGFDAINQITDIYQKNNGAIKEEAAAHQENTNAVKEETKAQEELNNVKSQTPDTGDDAEIIEKENGTLEDKLDLLRDIADQYGSNITQKDRDRYEELNQKDMDTGLTAKEEERYWDLGEQIDAADQALEEFGQTYDKIILKLENGKKVEILPDDKGLRSLYKFSDEYGETYNGIEIEDVIFERVKKEIAARQENVDAMKEEITAQKESNNATDAVVADNQKKIESYEELKRVVAEYIELAKQLKPTSTEEYLRLNKDLDRAGYFNDKKEGIAYIKSWGANVSRIAKAQKEGSSYYRHINSDGTEYDEYMGPDALDDARSKLRGYIYRMIQDFDYTIEEATNDFKGKNLQAFVKSNIESYNNIQTANEKYNAEAEEFNRPIEESMDIIGRTLLNQAEAISTDARSNVSKILDSLKYWVNEVNEHTQRVETDFIGRNIGLNTPYAEIEANAKKIESYEDLCNVIQRYRELSDPNKNLIYGGSETPGMTAQEYEEYRNLIGRLNKTGIDRAYDVSVGSTEEWAKKLGIEIPQAAKQAEESVSQITSSLKNGQIEADDLKQKVDAIADKSDDIVNNKTITEVSDAASADASTSADLTTLQGILEKITYKVQVIADHDIPNSDKTTLFDESKLEDILKRVFANIINPTAQQNDGDNELLRVIKEISQKVGEHIAQEKTLQEISTKVGNVKSGDGMSTDLNPHIITDQTGKPLEVYRGIRNSYGGLVSNRYHGGTFFTDDPALADKYSGKMGKKEKALISMKNPLEIDGKGTDWNKIEYIGHGADEASKKLIRLKDEINKISYELNRLKDAQEQFNNEIGGGGIYNTPDLIGDENYAKWKEYENAISIAIERQKALKAEMQVIFDDASNPYNFGDTNKFVEIAKQFGYDGVIFKNVKDGLPNPSNLFVTFQEEQIHAIETIATNFKDAFLQYISKVFNYDVGKYISIKQNEISDIINQFFNVNQDSSLLNQLNQQEDINSEYNASIIKKYKESFFAQNQHLKDFYSDFVEKQKIMEDPFNVFKSFNPEDALSSVQNNITQARNRLLKIQSKFNTTATSIEEYEREHSEVSANSKTSSLDEKELYKQIVSSVFEAMKAYVNNAETLANVKPTSTQQNDGDMQKPWALESTLQIVKGVLDTIQTNISKIGTIKTQQPVVTDVGNVLATENTLAAIKAAVEAINGKVIKGTKASASSGGSGAKTTRPKKEDYRGSEYFPEKLKTQTLYLAKFRAQLMTTGKLTDEVDAQIYELLNSLNLVKDGPDLSRWSEQFKQLRTEVGIKDIFDNYNEDENISVYNDLIDLQKLRYDLEIKYAKAKDGSQEKQFYQDQLNSLNSIISSQQIINENDEYENKLIQMKAQHERELGAIKAKEVDKSKKKNQQQKVKVSRDNARLSRSGSALNAARNTIESLVNIDDESINILEIKEIQDLSDATERLAKIRNKVNQSGYFIDDTEADILKDTTQETIAYTNQVKELINNYQKFSGENTKVLGSFIDGADWKKQATSLIMSATNGRAQIKKFDEANKQVVYTLKTGKNEITEYTAGVRNLDNKFIAVTGTTKKLESVFDAIKRKTKEIFTYFSGSSIIFKIVNELKRGIQYVKEIDSALTELKKVTDETEETYRKFLKTASKTGAEIGSTISDFTRATATFAKLGYNIDIASEMARAALVYQNVGDGIESADAAAESIISTMKGFGLQTSEAMKIVDRFNEVGNRFSITSKGIGDALQRSASALKEGGNSLDESIGLITAANSVVQDPETVGTALKTLTLRLRGAKTELEDAGLEAENMAETTSALQQKLLALTGGKVNIMSDANTFKNTTQILREMASAWSDMNDIQRAEWCPYVQKCA